MKKLILLLTLSSSLLAFKCIAQYKDMHDFSYVIPNGTWPEGSLTLAGNKLYGMTGTGGTSRFGNIFSIDTSGNNYTNLWNFNPSFDNDTNGANPLGSLIINGKKMYGMTQDGGLNGYGNVFSIDTNGGHYKDLWDFYDTGLNGNANGNGPEGDLVLSGNKLFGMTQTGGANGLGVLFSIDTNGGSYGAYKDLIDFNGTNGQFPAGGSLKVSGKTLFGMTNEGGAYSHGLIFSIDTNGNNYKDMLDFNGTNGEYPYGSLTLSGSVLYGMTNDGGANSNGIIFSIDTSGNLASFKDLWDFDDTGFIAGNSNGSHPEGSLTLHGSGLYGMTYYGGVNNLGLVFSVDTGGGNYNDLLDFDNTNGEYPYYTALTISKNVMYGMTYNGGASGYGLVFSDVIPFKVKVTETTNVNCPGGNTGNATAIISGGTAPYTYSWTTLPLQTTSMATGLSAGTYTINAIDSAGLTASSIVNITQPAAISITHDSVNDNGTCNGLAAVTVSGGTVPYTYLWTMGSQTTDTIKNQCGGTSYCCTITDNNGCTTTTCVTVKLSTGVNELAGAQNFVPVQIYPDPNNGQFTVNGVTKGQVIELYNYLGQKLNSVVVDNVIMRFDISSGTNGVYLIRILNKDGSLVTQKKMVKTQ